MRSRPNKNRNLTPPPPPPPEFLEKPRKRSWRPPTVKTVNLGETRSGDNSSLSTEFGEYFLQDS